MASNDKTSIESAVISGCAQGLSPLQWNPDIDKLLDKIGQGCKVVRYMDDRTIIVRDQYLVT